MASLIYVLLFCSYALSHSHMTLPMPKYTISQGDEDQKVPANFASLNFPQYLSGGLAGAPSAFLSYMGTLGLLTVRDFADKYGKKCGNTVPTTTTAVPDHFERHLGAHHIGPMEIWIDDNRVFYDDGVDQKYKDSTSIPVDFSSCKGSCVVRYVMVALHVVPPEVYDNCVTISGGSGKSTGKTKKQKQKQPAKNNGQGKKIKQQKKSKKVYTPANPKKVPVSGKPGVSASPDKNMGSASDASCSVGYMKCQGSGFATCTYGPGATKIWVPQACAPGTKCKANGNYILCA